MGMYTLRYFMVLVVSRNLVSLAGSEFRVPAPNTPLSLSAVMKCIFEAFQLLCRKVLIKSMYCIVLIETRAIR